MTYSTSDEEFLKSFDTSLDELQAELEEEDPEDTTEEDVDGVDEDVDQEEEDQNQEDDEDETEEEEDDELPGSRPVDEDDKSTTGVLKSGDVEPEQGTKEEPKDIDYVGFYKTIMTPFKANNKTIELRSPEEAIQLMQMGANYTRKMQELSKHRKTIATLEENGINTDEDLTFIIDIKNQNPEAIKKFFKDNNIDPFDIDTSDEVNYRPKAKIVSEETLETRSILEDLNSNPEGSKTLKLIADTWDEESTRFMWNNPSAFKIIHEQRESGVYDQIMSEIDRQTTLGILQPHGSILEKYNIVGNQLFGTGGQPQNDTTRKPIDTRVASRSSAQRSNKRAKAASSPRAGKRTSSMVLEDLAGLDDDKFLEAMKNRL